MMVAQHTTELKPKQEHSRQPQPAKPKATTQIKLMVTHITEITRGNYSRRKENRITVSGRILNHNKLYT
jgi:hypothetical protein